MHDLLLQNLQLQIYKGNVVKPVCNGHSGELENVANVPFMSSCPLYTGQSYMHYS